MESRTLLAAAGDLDLSFDGDGKVTVDFGNTLEDGGSVAVDSLGRVIVAGRSFQGGSTGIDFAVARFNTDGTLDTTFDGDGRATIDFGGTPDNCYSVAVDSQDRILLAGDTQPSPGFTDFAVARLNTDGSLDTSFDGDGKVTIDLGSTIDFGRSVAVDSLDRVVVGGDSFRPVFGVDFGVARLNTDGSLDTSFDGDGKAFINIGTPDERAYSVAVDSLDRVLIAGFSNQGGLTGYDFTVARLNANGSLDASFDGDGRATVDFGDDNDTGQSVTVDSVDRVVLGGFVDPGDGTGYDLAVARLNVNGSLDTSFDGDGKATVDFFGTDESQGAVAVDSLDRILVAGTTFNSSLDFAIARFNAGGGLDTSFSTDGKTTVAFGSNSDGARSVTVDSLGRILVGGGSDQGGSSSVDFAVARLLGASPNTGPSVAADNASVTVNEGQTATNSGTFSDPDVGDDVTITASEGTVTKSGANSGTWSWSKSTSDDEASHTVTITADDGNGGVATTTFTLTVNNVDPTARANSYSGAAATPLSGNVITDDTGAGVDSDPAGVNDPLTVSNHTQPDNGTVTVAADGSFTYTPSNTFTGMDSFSYTIGDGDNGFSTSTVTITVAPAAPGSVITVPDTCEPGTALLIAGTSGDDTIHIAPGPSSATLNVTINGLTTTEPKPTGRILVLAGAGNDDVQVAGTISNSSWLYGEAGNDRLNAGNASPGGNLLIGAAGNDQLNGGSGRDVMIGGQGADNVIGNPGDDILVAGYTLKDDRSAAGHESFWCDVLHEWTSSNGFLQRVDNLRNGTGGNAHNGASWLLPQTRDDGDSDQVDILNGTAGNDWFIFATGEDKVSGQIEASDIVT